MCVIIVYQCLRFVYHRYQSLSPLLHVFIIVYQLWYIRLSVFINAFRFEYHRLSMILEAFIIVYHGGQGGAGTTLAKTTGLGLVISV